MLTGVLHCRRTIQHFVAMLKTEPRSDATDRAAKALYTFAGRGACTGAMIRVAGGIQRLLAVASECVGSRAAEDALGTLAHLVMQETANQEAICAGGGIPILISQLLNLPDETNPDEDQPSRYADSMLSVMVMCSQSSRVKQTVQQAVASLPAGEPLGSP